MGVAWKDLEREVARRLDGSRVIRERWDKRDCDIRHHVYSIECKFRSTFGDWYNRELDRMRAMSGSTCIEREASDFVLEALDQAHEYCPTKPAMAVVKKKGLEYDNALVFMKIVDFPMSAVKHVKLMKGPLIAYTGLKEFTAYWQTKRYELMPEAVRYEGDE